MLAVMLAVMLSALMSSLTSIFNRGSTIFAMDLWTHIRNFQPGPTQNRLYKHRKWLEASNFAFRK